MGPASFWRALRREGTEVGHDRVGRLMTLDPAAAVRDKRVRTTVPAQDAGRPADLVDRSCCAHPNRLWVTDLTCFSSWTGFCCTALVIDSPFP